MCGIRLDASVIIVCNFGGSKCAMNNRISRKMLIFLQIISCIFVILLENMVHLIFFNRFIDLNLNTNEWRELYFIINRQFVVSIRMCSMILFRSSSFERYL